MECRNCNALLTEEAKFCDQCGIKVIREVICRVCKVKLSPEAKFCSECGTKVGKWSESVEVSKVFSDIVTEEWFGNNKSFYSVSNEYCDKRSISFRDRIYFINKSRTEVWSMLEDGIDEKFICNLPEGNLNQHIAVNRRGIFIYSDNTDDSIYHFDICGGSWSEIILPFKKDGYLMELFIFDTKLYYVDETYFMDSVDYKLCNICVYDIVDKSHKILYVGSNKEDIGRILVYSQGILFYNKIINNNSYSKGWFLLKKEPNIPVYLESFKNPADLVLRDPNKYERFPDNDDKCEIFAFDLLNNKMWTKLSREEMSVLGYDHAYGNRIFSREIGIAPNEKYNTQDYWVIYNSDTKVKITNDYYFNGKMMYYAPSYYVFHSVTREGHLSNNWTGNSIHGCTERIQMTGNVLIGDFKANGYDMIYPMSYNEPENGFEYHWNPKG